MMRYSIAAMQNHLDAGYKELPLVIPMSVLSWLQKSLSLFTLLA